MENMSNAAAAAAWTSALYAAVTAASQQQQQQQQQQQPQISPTLLNQLRQSNAANFASLQPLRPQSTMNNSIGQMSNKLGSSAQQKQANQAAALVSLLKANQINGHGSNEPSSNLNSAINPIYAPTQIVKSSPSTTAGTLSAISEVNGGKVNGSQQRPLLGNGHQQTRSSGENSANSSSEEQVSQSKANKSVIRASFLFRFFHFVGKIGNK